MASLDSIFSTISLSHAAAAPLVTDSVQAGFPSPAEDFVEGALDLNQHLIRRPAATFIVRVRGESMIGAGLDDSDLLVVDRSLEPRHDDIVIAAVDGELTVKRLHRRNGQVKLVADNPDYADILLADGNELMVWGVVTSCIKSFQR